jgi:hypothetical protein
MVGIALARRDRGLDPVVEPGLGGIRGLEPRCEERRLLAVEVVVVDEQDVRGS